VGGEWWVWVVTLVGLGAVIIADLIVVDRRSEGRFTPRRAAVWVGISVALAVAFGLILLVFGGADYAGQFAAGYLTEFSLSVDNLFVFYVLMTRFAVPRDAQHMVLLVGVVVALVFRGALIAVGAAALSRFDQLFYLFGAFLIWTALGILRGAHESVRLRQGPVARRVAKALRTTPEYDGRRLFTRRQGRRVATPILVVMFMIGSTDLLFALDSIPAIFGVTRHVYLVFTANAFALLGLRQLYFLIGGMLERLVYLNRGLAVILAFIGVKLILQTLHDDGVPAALALPTWATLVVIGAVLAVTVLTSMRRVHRDPAALRRADRPVSDGA
jgi:tellurite resistance protein TerC